MTGEFAPRLIGRYEIDGLLGRGGMGAVYSAHDPAIGRPVAIKLVSEGFRDPRARERLANEARAAGRLQHPGIVTIFDVGEHDGQLFIVMERVNGEPMSFMLSRRPRLLDLPTGLSLIEEACGALAYAHQMGIVHLDIKPDNLMVDQSGHVKILDFGIARVGGDDVTRTSSIVGSLRYMAPEQLTSGVGLDRRCDVFAVGCILYELVAGAPAFEGRITDAVARVLGDDPRPLVESTPGTDPDLSALVARMMSRDPKSRPSALVEVGHELTAIRARLTGYPVGPGSSMPAFASAPSATTTVAAATTRRVPRAALLVMALVLTSAIASVWLFARNTASPAASPSPAAVQTVSPPSTEASATPETVTAPRPSADRPSGSDTPPAETAPARGSTSQQTRRSEASRDRVGTDTPPQSDSSLAGGESIAPPATTQPAARSQPSVPASPPEPRTTTEATRETPGAPATASPAPVQPAPPPVARGVPGPLPPAAPAPISDEARVLAALARYKQAFEERRPEVLAEVYPSLTNEQRVRLRRDLSAVDRYAIEFANTRVTVRGETATVTAVVTREMQPRVGGLQRNSTPTEFHFHKAGEEWVIDGITAR